MLLMKVKRLQDIDEVSDEDRKLLVKCSSALYQFCNVGQRSIWMNFLDLFDKIFEAVRTILICSVPLPRSTMSSLLQLYILLNKWTGTNQRRFNTVGTQTTCKFN